MNNFEQEYKNAMNEIHASEELRGRIMNIKPQKRRSTPIITSVASVAAAVMILVVANDYDFTPNTDGVITQTVISTQAPQKPVETEIPHTPVIEKTMPTAKPKTVTQPQTTAEVNVTVTETETEPQVVTHNELEGVPMTARAGGNEESATQVWSVDKYFEYIGKNVHGAVNSVITAQYTGDAEFEFLMDENDTPVQDVVMLSYSTQGGADISITVSKAPMFETGNSGSITETDSGYIGYKVSDGTYYMITASGITRDGMTALVDNF